MQLKKLLLTSLLLPISTTLFAFAGTEIHTFGNIPDQSTYSNIYVQSRFNYGIQNNTTSDQKYMMVWTLCSDNQRCDKMVSDIYLRPTQRIQNQFYAKQPTVYQQRGYYTYKATLDIIGESSSHAQGSGIIQVTRGRDSSHPNG